MSLSILAQRMYWADSIANVGVVYCHSLADYDKRGPPVNTLSDTA